MEQNLQAIRDLPPYLPPSELAKEIQPIVDKLREMYERQKIAKAYAERGTSKDWDLVWLLEREIRDYVKKYEHLGLRGISKEQFAYIYGQSEQQENADGSVFLSNVAAATSPWQLRDLAESLSHKPAENPYRKEDYSGFFFPVLGKFPQWRDLDSALERIVHTQNPRIKEMHQMLEQILANESPSEIESWVEAVESTTKGQKDPYETLREIAFWLTDGFSLIGVWSRLPLWEPTPQNQKRWNNFLLFLESLSILIIISISIIAPVDTIIASITGVIAMPFVFFAPYLAYISYRVREIADPEQWASKGGKNMQFWVFYVTFWVMMIIPYIVHRIIPKQIAKGIKWYIRRRRLEQALEAYLEDLGETQASGDALEQMLSLSKRLDELRRRFEIVPITAMPDLCSKERYIVLDLAQAHKNGQTKWLRVTQAD